MYEISVKGNYLIVNFKTERDTKYRQFPCIKTVYSFNGTDFKINEGEIMNESVIITAKDIENRIVTINGAIVNASTLESYLQNNTAKFK